MVVGSKKVWEELGAKRTSEHRRQISRNARNVSKMCLHLIKPRPLSAFTELVKADPEYSGSARDPKCSVARGDWCLRSPLTHTTISR